MSLAVMIIHILACIGLVLVVLLQTGKGASMGAAFGGSSQTVFGSSGAATFMAKMTTGIAVLFMLTSLGLAFFSAGNLPSSVVSGDQPAAQSEPAPAQPAQPAVPAPKAPEVPKTPAP